MGDKEKQGVYKMTKYIRCPKWPTCIRCEFVKNNDYTKEVPGGGMIVNRFSCIEHPEFPQHLFECGGTCDDWKEKIK